MAYGQSCRRVSQTPTSCVTRNTRVTSRDDKIDHRDDTSGEFSLYISEGLPAHRATLAEADASRKRTAIWFTKWNIAVRLCLRLREDGRGTDAALNAETAAALKERSAWLHHSDVTSYEKTGFLSTNASAFTWFGPDMAWTCQRKTQDVCATCAVNLVYTPGLFSYDRKRSVEALTHFCLKVSQHYIYRKLFASSKFWSPTIYLSI